VIAALPMDDKRELVVHNVDDDLLDQQANDLLTRLDRDSWLIPGQSEVFPEYHQSCTILSRHHRHLLGCEAIELILEFAQAAKLLVPASLKLSGDEPVIWIDRIILPARPIHLVSSLSTSVLDLPSFIAVLPALCLEDG